MEYLIYSQSVRSTGDNLDFQLVSEVMGGGSLVGLGLSLHLWASNAISRQTVSELS